jgi:Tol biopolymer transport system component
VPITGLAYDLAPAPGSDSDFLFTFSRGMGLGSEMWIAHSGGQIVGQLMADSHNYLSFARWSPDRAMIAFIKVPDSATPFTVGALWVMQANGSSARKLADADAGHGFAEAWSPDGGRIAFVVRDNPNDTEADQNAGALKSHVGMVNVKSAIQSSLANVPNAGVEAPVWSPDGRQMAFTAVRNDKMNVYLADVASGQVQPVLSVSACCPVWMRK